MTDATATTPCPECLYDARMTHLATLPVVGYCAVHGQENATAVYVDAETTTRRAYRADPYGLMVEYAHGWRALPNARVDARHPDARRTGSYVPMAAAVARTMRDVGIGQDEAVRVLGGTP